MKPRLLIITSHPIQYQAPWFRALHADDRIDLDVLFLALPDAIDQGVGFGTAFEWDIPLLDGYRWQKAQSSQGRISDGRNGLVWNDARADIRALSPDVVLVTGWQNRGLLQGMQATAQFGLPLLIRAESNGLAPGNFLRRLRHRWILRHASCLLPIGKANRIFYQRLRLDRRVGATAPYFVDNEFFANRSNEALTRREQIRAEWGIPAESVCFLFVGKFVDKKRPADLLAALALLGKQHEHVHVLMVGTGPLEKEIRAFVAERHLPVSFAGFLNQTEIPAAYAVADCLVLPSDYGETWGLVVNEAMACGLPAIVSDRVGCGLDLVSEGATGFCFEFGNPSSLAAAMLKMCEMPEADRKMMGTSARDLVFTQFSTSRTTQSTIEATQQVAREVPY